MVLQAHEAADAVVDVDHEISGCQGRHLLQEVLGAPLLLAAAHQTVAEDVLFADHCEIAGRESLFEPQNGERHGAGRQAERLPQGPDRLGLLQAVLVQDTAQAVARALAPGRHDDAPSLALKRTDVLDRDVEDVHTFLSALRRERAARPSPAIHHGRLARADRVGVRHPNHGRVFEFERATRPW